MRKSPPDDDDAMPYDPVHSSPLDREAVPDIERHLLACCLWAGADDPGLDDAAELVTPDDFVLAAHGAVFAAALECRRDRGAVLAADVADRLTKAAARDQKLAGVLPDLGGDLYRWLSDTRDLEPYGGHARILARLVREAALFRRLRAVAAEISRLAVMPTGPAAEVLTECEKLLFDLSDASVGTAHVLHAAPEMMRAAGERVDARQSSGGALGGLSVGYPDLDEILGGLRPGQMVVVGARPGGGKTAIALNVAARVANGGTPTLFFSLEMPQDQIADRLLSMGSGVPMSKLTKGRRLSGDEVDRLSAALGSGWVGGSALFCDDSSDMPAQRMAAVLRRAVRQHGIGLAVVDYLQLIRPENPRDNRTQQVGTAARRVKQMARECGVPVLCLCQLNRQVEQRGADARPKLSDLRESGEIEQHADMVMLLHTRPDQSQDLATWEVDVLVAKNRNGPVGDVPMVLRRATMTFENSALGDRRAA